MDGIKVSIICNTYNHEKYIGECLESFVTQKTDFGFEILVHDDASTDGTAAVIRRYEEKYPNLIRPIYQEENQYSKGNSAADFQLPRVRGEYIALCEGDDYWTDINKLQKQIDKLDRNPGIDICAHAAIVIDAISGKKVGKIAPSKKETVFSVEDVIMGEGGFVATGSIMYRAAINKGMPDFRKQFRFDYTTQVHGALKGGLLYLPETMSIYRHNAPGSWSAKRGREKLREFNERKNKMLDTLDRETGGKYHEVILARKSLNRLILNNYKGTSVKDLLVILRHLPLKKKAKVLTLTALPQVKTIKRLLKRY